jgi:hypothetical protein
VESSVIVYLRHGASTPDVTVLAMAALDSATCYTDGEAFNFSSGRDDAVMPLSTHALLRTDLGGLPVADVQDIVDVAADDPQYFERVSALEQLPADVSETRTEWSPG